MPDRMRTVLDGIAVAMLLLAAVWLGAHYAALPEGLPSHINGVSAHASHKVFVWLPIIVGVWVVILLSLASWVMTSGVAMDARAQATPERVEASRRVMSALKVVFAAGVALYTWHVIP